MLGGLGFAAARLELEDVGSRARSSETTVCEVMVMGWAGLGIFFFSKSGARLQSKRS